MLVEDGTKIKKNNPNALTFYMLNFDKWLSKQLYLPSYHLSEDKINLFTQNDIPSGPVFIDAKVELNDYVKKRRLHKLNFKSITTNIHFKKKISSKKFEKNNCRFANLKDKAAIKKIAYNSFINSRFHLDKRFSIASSEAIKGSPPVIKTSFIEGFEAM